MNRNRISSTVVVAFLLICCGAGCAVIKGEKTFRESFSFGKKGRETARYPKPVKMAVTWTPDIIVRTGSTPTRGFGGRIFFYDEQNRPVPVEGELAVQAIASMGDETQEVKRYAFTPEQFTRYYSQTDLGASYSIWIPWDAVGGDEKKITLVPSFKPTDGGVVQGANSVVSLPGKKRLGERSFDLESIADGSYRGGAWSLGNVHSASAGLTTTTIPMKGAPPRSLPPGGNHNANALAAQMLAQLQQQHQQQGEANASGVQTVAVEDEGTPAVETAGAMESLPGVTWGASPFAPLPQNPTASRTTTGKANAVKKQR